MRALVAVLALLAAFAAPAPAATADRPDAQMLLDLDLLREIDPRAQRSYPVVDTLRLLEFLRRLPSPAAARPAPHTAPSPKRAC
jgi:hypothetical protein